MSTRSESSIFLPSLAEKSRADLIDLWASNYGNQPPKGTSRRLLEHAAAYEMQVAALGGLKPRTRRSLNAAVTAGSLLPVKQQPAPGTRLVREWNGRIHTAETLDNGFEWNGQTFRSLSAVAHAITGAKWSGPRFFGL